MKRIIKFGTWIVRHKQHKDGVGMLNKVPKRSSGVAPNMRENNYMFCNKNYMSQ
jgi:hypothetical protein